MQFCVDTAALKSLGGNRFCRELGAQVHFARARLSTFLSRVLRNDVLQSEGALDSRESLSLPCPQTAMAADCHGFDQRFATTNTNVGLLQRQVDAISDLHSQAASQTARAFRLR